MAPWEKYQSGAKRGPWSKYQTGGEPQPPAENSIGGFARAVGTGLRRGIESFAGLPGDVGELMGNAAGWAAGKMGASETGQETARKIKYLNPFGPLAATTEDIQEDVTTPILGEHYQPKTTLEEYGETGGEFAGGGLIGKGSLARRMFTQVLAPAVGSETAGQAARVYAPEYEPYARLGGAVAGAAGPAAVSRAVTPFPASAQRRAMVEALEREGVDSLTAGQKTGSERLRYMESELGGFGGQQMMERQGEQFTRAALSKAGINADRATPEVVDQALTRIGKEFDDLAAQTQVPFDQQLQNDMLKVATEYQSVAANVAPVVEQMMNRAGALASQNGGVLAGEAYKNLRTEIGDMIRKSDGTTQQALKDLQDALDDAVERHMPPEFIDRWQTVRGQYKNMLVIERAATGAGENTAMGILSPSQVRGATVNQNRRAYARGRGDMSELARAGEAVMKPLPQSGTAPRTAARNFVAAIPAVAGAAVGGQAGGYPGAAAGMAAGAALPSVVGRAMLSKPGRKYLSNQALNTIPSGDPRIAALISIMNQKSDRQSLPPPSR